MCIHWLNITEQNRTEIYLFKMMKIFYLYNNFDVIKSEINIFVINTSK